MAKIKWYSKGKFREDEIYNPSIEPYLQFVKYKHRDAGSYDGYRFFVQKKGTGQILNGVNNEEETWIAFTAQVENITEEEFDLIKKNIIKITNNKGSSSPSIYREFYWRDLLKQYMEEEFFI